jgi:hypothetical protein
VGDDRAAHVMRIRIRPGSPDRVCHLRGLDASIQRKPYDLDAAPDGELVKELLEYRFDCALRDAELSPDVPVTEAVADAVEDLPLPGRQDTSNRRVRCVGHSTLVPPAAKQFGHVPPHARIRPDQARDFRAGQVHTLGPQLREVCTAAPFDASAKALVGHEPADHELDVAL